MLLLTFEAIIMKKIILILLAQASFLCAQPVYFQKIFGSSGTDAGRSIRQLSSGAIFIAGYADSATVGSNDYTVAKLDKFGNLIWINYYGDSLNNIALCINTTNDGNLIVCGQTEISSGNEDAFVCKLDTNGAVLWYKTYGGSLNQSLKYIEATFDKGYIACGFTSDMSGSNDYYIIKLDSLGNQQWIGNYGGSFNDYADMVLQTPDSGYIITGDTNSDGAGGYDVEVIRLDANGSVVWDKLYGDSLQNGCQGILALKNGGYLSYGETGTSTSGTFDFFIQKLDVLGNSLFRQTFGGIKSDALFSLVEAYDGGFVFTGYSNSYSSGPLNLVIGKTDSLANLLWVNAYGSSGIDIGYEIINERDSGFLVIGNTYQNGSDEYFLFHVNDSGKVVGMPDWKERLDQVQVYPNPNKGIIRIVLPTKASGEFRLELFTLDGQCVYMDSQQQQYSNELVVDFGDYHTGGVYFLKITHLLENYYAKIFVTN